MKLKAKVREGGKVHRKYDVAKTPYQRLMESDQIPSQAKEELRATYLSLNPAQLKRSIEAKPDQLYRLYQGKKTSCVADPFKKQTPRMVTNYMIQPDPISVT